MTALAGRAADAGGVPVKLSLIEAAPTRQSFSELLWGDEPGHAAIGPVLRVERMTTVQLHAPDSESATLDRLREIFADAAYTTFPLFAARLHDVGLDLAYGLVTDAEGRIIKETASVAEGTFGGLGDAELLRAGLAGAAILDRPVLHLFHRATPAYGHFVLDGLAQLAAFLRVIQAGQLDVLVPPFLPDWAVRAMIAMGVPELALQRPQGSTLRCKRLVTISAMETLETFFPHPALLTGLAATVLSGLALGSGRRIYLSRARQTAYSQRSLANEQALTELLAARGFEILEPGNMPFADQARAFAEAAVIIGAHGSSFGNLVFARPGTTVIDLMPAGWVGHWGGTSAERWLLNMTTALRLNYELVLCPSRTVQLLPEDDQSGLQKTGMESMPDLALVARVLDGLPAVPGPAPVVQVSLQQAPAAPPAASVRVTLAEAAPRVMPFSDLLWGNQPGHAVLAPERHVARESAVHLHGAESEAAKLAELRIIFADSGYGAPAVMAARLDDVSLDLAYGFVMDSEGRILQETAHVAEQIFGDLAGADLLREGLAGAETLTRPVLHLFHRSTPAYGHFVLDVLAPLMHFLPAIRVGQLDVLVPPFMPGWAVPALLALGVPETALQKPVGRTLRCRQLVTLSAIETRETFLPNPAMLAPMAAAAPLDEARGSGRRIYLSRARQNAYSQRSLRNEEALIAMLAARGFEILEPGNMPFADQARAFAEAAIIIGAHGSSFGNLVFARPGTTVIDLMPADWVGYWGGRHAERWLLNLTSALRLHYEVVLCPSRKVQLELGADQQGLQQTGMESTADLELIARVIESLSPAVPAPRAPAQETGLASLMAPVLDPVFAWPECIGTNSAWWGHVPFAAWLVTTLRPRQLVELGSWRGVSYFTFCQAVLASELDCRCHAVDSWEGDPHAGLYGPEVFEAFSRFNDALYSRVSTIHRMTFDSAAAAFEDGTVDLLHIDGLHTYDAVRHDFETWLPKMSPRGVILFHDVTERQEGFGVWRLWEEVSAKWPAFLFPHSHGLGVLCVGAETAPELLALCGMPPAEAERVCHRFGLLGGRWQVQNQLLISRGQVRAMEQDLRRLQAEATRLAAEEARLRQIESSSTWRATAPLRKALGRFPAMASFVRKSLKVAWWAVTLQLPARLAQRRARPPS